MTESNKMIEQRDNCFSDLCFVIINDNVIKYSVQKDVKKGGATIARNSSHIGVRLYFVYIN